MYWPIRKFKKKLKTISASSSVQKYNGIDFKVQKMFFDHKGPTPWSYVFVVTSKNKSRSENYALALRKFETNLK